MKKNKKALGGALTHGGIFSNGVEYIGNGSTHEENPLEGVPMGVDPQGVPNLVEEGELIWNDYVFSNRLKVPKAIRLKYKLRETTFAEAAKDMQKESEERPNDPISQDGLNAIFSDLAMAQEEVRMRKEGNKFAKGGKLGKLFEGPGPDPNVLDIETPYGMYNGATPYDYSSYFTLDPKNKNKVTTYTDAYKKARFDADMARMYAGLMEDKDSSLESFLAKGNKLEDLTDEDVNKYSLDGNYGWLHNARVWAMDTQNNKAPELPRIIPEMEIKEVTPVIEDEELEEIAPIPARTIKNSPLRYAPIIGHGLGVFSDLFSKPDYSAANTVDNVDVNPALVGFNPIGNYLRYTPFDRDYYINKLNADTAASRRNIMNTSGGNRATALAGLLASDFNYGTGLGQLARQAEEYNLAQRQQVEDFNRATNIFNTEAGLKAAMANADSRNKATALRLDQANRVAAYRQAAKDAYNARRSNNLNVLLEELGGLGTENTFRSMIDWMADKGVIKVDSEGNFILPKESGKDTKSNKKAKGGKLKTKKKKGFTYG